MHQELKGREFYNGHIMNDLQSYAKKNIYRSRASSSARTLPMRRNA